jgi:hypothetical protein
MDRCHEGERRDQDFVLEAQSVIRQEQTQRARRHGDGVADPEMLSDARLQLAQIIPLGDDPALEETSHLLA